MDQRIRVEVESDHIQKIASGKPIPAISELVWNALDADATRVDVEVDEDELGMRSVSVRDNGHGIPHNDVADLFGKLGGSWKRHGTRSKSKNRILHGKEGKGRFRALGIGGLVEWTVRWLDDGQVKQYRVSILREDPTDVIISTPEPVSSALGTGVDVTVHNLDRTYRSLQTANALSSISEVFALYLTDYREVSVFVDGERVDPESSIKNRTSLELPSVEWEGEKFHSCVELIEWQSSDERWLFLCSEDGVPFVRTTPRFHAPGHHFSLYVKSRLITRMQNEGVLELSDMVPALTALVEGAAEKAKLYFKQKDATQARSEIDEWKVQKVYPYKSEPRGKVEEAERKVFDIVALNVKRHLSDFSESSHKTKAFQLSMIKQAIEKGPDELQTILNEVLGLPPAKQKELAKLLEESSLSNVISASKLVSDRLKFIKGLEILLFDPEYKKRVKERSQLHRVLADDNTWLFGEEFSLTVDDRSLTEVLRKHQKVIGRETVIDSPVKRIDNRKGIVDLMLSKSVPQSRSENLEHLVIELKRPNVKLGMSEISQIKSYAYAIAEDERFEAVNTRWNFWVVSNAFSKDGRREARQGGRPPGQVYKSEDGSIEVWCKTWAEILQEASSRMKFVENKLKANIDRESSLKHLQATYEKYLSGVVQVEDETESAVEEVGA